MSDHKNDVTPTTKPTPPGWYDDGNGNQRYWDGAQWTEQTAAGRGTGIQPSATKPHVLSWIALAVAVVGFIFAGVPGALIVGWVLLPVAFILSIVGFFLKGKKWATITALAVSVVGTIVGFIVFFAAVATSFNDALAHSDATVSQPESSQSSESSESSDKAPGEKTDAEVGTRENPAALGSTITGKDWTVTINSVTLNADDTVAAANQFNDEAPAGYSYAVVNTTMTYTGEDSGIAALVQIDYVTNDGKVIDRSDNMAVAPEPTIGLDELYKDASVTGNIVLALPDGDDGLLRVAPGRFGDKVFVAVQ